MFNFNFIISFLCNSSVLSLSSFISYIYLSTRALVWRNFCLDRKSLGGGKTGGAGAGPRAGLKRLNPMDQTVALVSYCSNYQGCGPVPHRVLYQNFNFWVIVRALLQFIKRNIAKHKFISTCIPNWKSHLVGSMNAYSYTYGRAIRILIYMFSETAGYHQLLKRDRLIFEYKQVLL